MTDWLMTGISGDSPTINRGNLSPSVIQLIWTENDIFLLMAVVLCARRRILMTFPWDSVVKKVVLFILKLTFSSILRLFQLSSWVLWLPGRPTDINVMHFSSWPNVQDIYSHSLISWCGRRGSRIVPLLGTTARREVGECSPKAIAKRDPRFAGPILLAKNETNINIDLFGMSYSLNRIQFLSIFMSTWAVFNEKDIAFMSTINWYLGHWKEIIEKDLDVSKALTSS